jgi:[ribosomal protein S5]-alanine N-acetyltransferase
MLIGKKVCLAPVLVGDGPALFNWSNSLDLVRTNGHYRPTDQLHFNQWLSNLSKDPARVVFTIRRQGNLQLLGWVQVFDIQPVTRSAEIGILVGDAAHRGQGFGQEAMGMALRYCWRDLNLQRVSLSVVGDNPGAIHVYGKAGFALEGIRRRAAYSDGRFHDVTLMGVLRSEDAGG